MIAACDWPQALRLLQDCKRPDVVAYTLALSRASWQVALAILKDLRRHKLQATVVTYGALLSACQRAAQWQQAVALLQEMRKESVRANVVAAWRTNRSDHSRSPCFRIQFREVKREGCGVVDPV